MLAEMFPVVAVGDAPAVRVEFGSATCDELGSTCGEDAACGGCVAVDIGVGLEVGVGVGREVGVEVGFGVDVGVGFGVGVGAGEQISEIIHPELIA